MRGEPSKKTHGRLIANPRLVVRKSLVRASPGKLLQTLPLATQRVERSVRRLSDVASFVSVATSRPTARPETAATDPKNGRSDWRELAPSPRHAPPARVRSSAA